MELVSLFMLVIFIASFAGALLAPSIVRRFGKKGAYVAATLIAALGFMLVRMTAGSNHILYMVLSGSCQRRFDSDRSHCTGHVYGCCRIRVFQTWQGRQRFYHVHGFHADKNRYCPQRCIYRLWFGLYRVCSGYGRYPGIYRQHAGSQYPCCRAPVQWLQR